MTNKYAGVCNACGKKVGAQDGHIERAGRRWIVWCGPCFDRSDNSSYEDRCCGDRAYEDRCAEQCGY